jgi:hypothetical protein
MVIIILVKYVADLSGCALSTSHPKHKAFSPMSALLLCFVQPLVPKLMIQIHSIVCRRSTGPAGKLPDNWEDLRRDMNYRIALNVVDYDMKPELMYSMDQTFCVYVPTGEAHTYDKKNAKRVNLSISIELRSDTGPYY